MSLLQAPPAALPAWYWRQVEARLHETAPPRERWSLWMWWNRRRVARLALAVASACVVGVTAAIWAPLPPLNRWQDGANITEYAQVVSYAQSSLVDDPLNENTQIILSGWRDEGGRP